MAATFRPSSSSYEYARAMPWLADTARIERAWLDAYHAADAEPLSAVALGSFPQERLAELGLCRASGDADRALAVSPP